MQFAGIIVNDDLRCFLKSMAENVKGMSWRFTALHDFKPITYAMGAEDRGNKVYFQKSHRQFGYTDY